MNGLYCCVDKMVATMSVEIACHAQSISEEHYMKCTFYHYCLALGTVELQMAIHNAAFLPYFWGDCGGA